MQENVIFTQTFKSPVGELIIGDCGGKLCLCDWKYRKMRTAIDERIAHLSQCRYEEKSTDLIIQTKEELTKYFNNDIREFSIPLIFFGSEFQQHIWNLLLKIPFGKSISYLTLSKQFGDEKAIRAVASANGANAISIIVPCHRVIGNTGDLTGYAGGLDAKKKLLQLEKINTQIELF